jgi:DNA-binding transcriptional MerR regulator/methylmalonyl-CoA mutase cobalamin-binding subunit
MPVNVPMGVIVKRTGLSPHVIRIWERRYQAVSPARTEGGHRSYREEDVLRLILLRQLTEAGHKISGIAKLTTAELETIAGRNRNLGNTGATAGREERRIAEMVQCIGAMDRAGVQELFRKSAVEFGAHGSLERILGPLAEKVGEIWREGTLNAVHEHFATVSIREFLWGSIQPYSASSNAPALLVTTPSGQLHELGAIIVGTAAADIGWRTIYLGPSLPAAEISHAAAQNEVRAVALSIVYPEDDSSLPGELETLRTYLPQSIPIIVGGRAAGAYADVLDKIGAVQPRTLSALYDELNSIRRTRRGSK